MGPLNVLIGKTIDSLSHYTELHVIPNTCVNDKRITQRDVGEGSSLKIGPLAVTPSQVVVSRLVSWR